MRGSRVLALLVGLGASCASPLTEIVLVVDTDITSADTFHVVVQHPDGDRSESSANLTLQPAPRTLVLVHRGGPLGPMNLSIEALQSGTTLVAVEREVTFVPSRSLRLRVFVTQACATVVCDMPGQTCGNDGTCRSRVVTACEYENADCGDGGNGDAGPCILNGQSMCGVAGLHLPGDRISPVLCTPPPAAVVTTVSGPGGDVASTGGPPPIFSVDQSGAHTVRIALDNDASCAVERTFQVVPTNAIPDSNLVSLEDLRDLAARAGTAFIAGRRGAYAIDASGWYDLRSGGATGDIAPEDLWAVGVHGGDAFFGTLGDVGFVYRITAQAPFDSSVHEAISLPGGSREVRAIAARIDDADPLLVATRDGAVTIDAFAAMPRGDQQGGAFDPGADGWAAIATLAQAGRGAIWLGTTSSIRNVAMTGATAFGGNPVALPSWIPSAHAGAVDDRDAAASRLWVCGDGGVAMWVMEGDWSALTDLPPPTHLWSGVCRDLALSQDGDAWVASGTAGLIRLDPTAMVVATYDANRGLPAGASVDRVATAFDATTREVWMLDTSGRAVLSLSADPLP